MATFIRQNVLRIFIVIRVIRLQLFATMKSASIKSRCNRCAADALKKFNETFQNYDCARISAQMPETS